VSQPPGRDDLGAIVLAGGRASRLGGTDKPALRVGERSLIASVLAEAEGAGARQVVVVGPDRPGLALAGRERRVVREDPPGRGPVPALHRGLAEITTAWVLLLAADLPFLRTRHLRSLLAAAQREGQSTGSVLADDTGRPQWLASCWPADALRRAAAGYSGNSLHGLLRPLRPVLLALPPGDPGPPPWLDCDTPEDVRLARAWSSVRPGDGGEGVADELAGRMD
jgi:molybdopterin-guanine dinucleotide biosynthesis protein A